MSNLGKVLKLLLTVCQLAIDKLLLFLGHSPLEAARAAFSAKFADVDDTVVVFAARRARSPGRFEQRKIISNLVLSVVDLLAFIPDSRCELVVFLVAKILFGHYL